MNERDAQHLWVSYGNMYGQMTTLENVGGASVPDLVFACHGIIMFMEMKKLYSGKYIYCGNYQWSYAVRLRHQVHQYQHHYVVADMENEGLITYRIYTVPQILKIKPEQSGGKLKFDVSGIAPVFTVRNPEEFKLYLEYLNKENFGE